MSESVIDVLLASLAENTWKQYAGPLNLWCQFCRDLDTDPYNATANDILDFLRSRYNSGASYGTLNSSRAAISLISTLDVTKEKMLSRFFKGIFRLRPIKPKYDEIWDVAPVLTFISNMYPLEKLSIQELSERLVTLLALGTAHRAQTFAVMQMTDITRSNDGYQIKISELIKTSRPGALQPLLLLPFFKEKPELCIAGTLEKYLDVTKSLRGDCTNVILTSRKPFKAASRETISRWIRSVLTKSGINKKFSAHSTRHAATSAALAKGIDISVIKNTAGWSQGSHVFAKFYNRPIKATRKDFATTVVQ